LQSVFNLPLFFDFIQLTRVKLHGAISKSGLSTLEFIFYLSCKLRMISIFTRYLAHNLSQEKKHKKLLWKVVNVIQLLDKNLSLFKAIRIYVTGKLNGKMRRKTYMFKIGRLPLQKINIDLDYFKSSSFTKFGTISIKI